MSDFKREERYIVVKLKDIDAEETEAFREFLQSWQIPTRECVVVESYWPNYEDTWKAVEQVANGEYQSPYDLIEQQQVRIAELEATNKVLEQNRDQYKREAYALAATVERLREAGTKLRDDIDLSKIVGAGKRNFANEWGAAVSATPAANLSHVKREVAKEAFIAGFDKGRIKLPVVDLRTPNGLAKEYANQRYPDKDGE